MWLLSILINSRITYFTLQALNLKFSNLPLLLLKTFEHSDPDATQITLAYHQPPLRIASWRRAARDYVQTKRQYTRWIYPQLTKVGRRLGGHAKCRLPLFHASMRQRDASVHHLSIPRYICIPSLFFPFVRQCDAAISRCWVRLGLSHTWDCLRWPLTPFGAYVATSSLHSRK